MTMVGRSSPPSPVSRPSTLVMSQSLSALLCSPLVTIWKPLAVAVCSSTSAAEAAPCEAEAAWVCS